MRAPTYPSAHASLIGLAALVLGLTDATLVSFSALGAAGAFQYVPPRIWVIAPLCWLAAALILAVPAYAISRRHGAALTIVFMIALAVFVRSSGQPWKRITAGVLGAIVGIAIVRFVAGRWLTAPKRMSFALAALVAIVLILGVVVMTRAEQTSQTSSVNAAPGPDVLLVFLDTVSYDAIFRDGHAVDPHLGLLTKLAERGAVFERAYTPAPWTLPAHFSAVTGIPAHRLGIGFDHQTYDGTAATLASRFRRRGYRTAAVISNTFLNRGTGFARGFDTFEHAMNALDVCRTPPGMLLDRWWPWFAASVCNWNADEVTRRARRQVARDDGRPLFLLLNYMDAHDPYYVGPECPRRRDANPLPRDVAARNYRGRYYASHLGAIQCIDRHLAALVTQLATRNRETVIAVIADHGEQFGEHGLVRHGNSLFDRLLHVPFLVTGPHVRPRVLREPVSIAALSSVLLEIADRGDFELRNTPVISSLTPPAAVAESAQWSLIRDRWHLIHHAGTDSLYDLPADPEELTDLAFTAEAQPTAKALRDALATEMRSHIQPDSTTFRSLGYIDAQNPAP